MRAAVAILFSCLLLWVQGMAALAPHLSLSPAHSSLARKVCDCCACGTRQCCPSPRPVDSPRPATPLARTVARSDQAPAQLRQPTPPVSFLFGSPDLSGDSASPAVSAPPDPASAGGMSLVPLFERDCALLL